MRAEAEPAEYRPAQRPGHPAPADRTLQRRPPQHPQHQVQAELDDRRIQARGRQRRDRQHPPVLPDRVRRDQRQRHARGHQPHHQRDRHADQARGGAAAARDGVVTGQLDLGGHRPHRARHVLAQLPDEQHPDRRGQRQRRAEVGQQRPPGQHHAAEPGDRAHRGAGHVPAVQPDQRRVHLRPLRDQPVAGQPHRTDEQRGTQPRAPGEIGHASSVLAGAAMAVSLAKMAILPLASGATAWQARWLWVRRAPKSVREA